MCSSLSAQVQHVNRLRSVSKDDVGMLFTPDNKAATKQWSENRALKFLGGTRKQMCWMGTYVSISALTPHSCVTASSLPYQIGKNKKEYDSWCFVMDIPCHRVLIRDVCTHGGLLLASLTTLCAICVQWLNGGQDGNGSNVAELSWGVLDMSSICWLWHGDTQTTLQQLS